MARLGIRGIACSKARYHDILNGKRTIAIENQHWNNGESILVGDTLYLHKTIKDDCSPCGHKYTGRAIKAIVTDITENNYPEYGMVHVKFKVVKVYMGGFNYDT